MPSKELIALAANAMEERRKELIAQPLSRIYPQLAEAAAGAILAALQEPDQSMLGAAEDICVDGPYLGRLDADLVWCQMLAASALGEQSE
ncbi:hypothetical protein N7376_15810 [Brucella intermedia GD04153]|uniref:Uncharacterized protein n=1 Tax=Brucella intermedia GD04153 TaxID=2975438 RepID=A0AA42GZZ9_9HYPH|nr:hypothetical protein [Brucella intermedia]MDH0125474.1 hypothetical protein [Brucella intermedia GD04153]